MFAYFPYRQVYTWLAEELNMLTGAFFEVTADGVDLLYWFRVELLAFEAAEPGVESRRQGRCGK